MTNNASPYRARHKELKLERQEINQGLAMDVIKPIQMELAAQTVFVPKKDGNLRFCVDSHKLNAVMIWDSYWTRDREACTESLGDASIFPTLDINRRYWKVEIAEEDGDKTIFTFHHGHFRFNLMPFRLTNEPRTFQRAMAVFLANVQWQFSLVYLGGIVLLLRTLD